MNQQKNQLALNEFIGCPHISAESTILLLIQMLNFDPTLEALDQPSEGGRNVKF